MKKNKIDILSDEAIKSKIKIDEITDDLYKIKEHLVAPMSEEDTEVTNNYFNEVMNGITPAAEKINQILDNERSRTLLATALKNAIKDEEWLEKLSKTSLSHILEQMPETK